MCLLTPLKLINQHIIPVFPTHTIYLCGQVYLATHLGISLATFGQIQYSIPSRLLSINLQRGEKLSGITSLSPSQYRPTYAVVLYTLLRAPGGFDALKAILKLWDSKLIFEFHSQVVTTGTQPFCGKHYISCTVGVECPLPVLSPLWSKWNWHQQPMYGNISES